MLKKLDGEIKVIVANPNLPPAGPHIPGTTAQLPQQSTEGWFLLISSPKAILFFILEEPLLLLNSLK